MIQRNHRQSEQGFIALISVIIISLVLLTLTVMLNTTSFFSRFSILDAEYKERSQAAAESCVSTALLNIAQDPTYNPVSEPHTVGVDHCTVVSVAYNTPVAGQETIKTQAVVSNAYTNLQVVVNMTTLAVVSWEEIPTF